jgi:zinc-ribbon domain
MSYCPKCGNTVDEAMVFCPHCGASLKGTATPCQAPPTQPYQNEKAEKNERREKQEKREHPEKGEHQEKSEYGFVGYLIGGLILITIGVFALLDLTSPLNSNQDLAAMLLVIGVIIIVGAVYVAISARKRFPSIHLSKYWPQKHSVKSVF